MVQRREVGKSEEDRARYAGRLVPGRSIGSARVRGQSESQVCHLYPVVCTGGLINCGYRHVAGDVIEIRPSNSQEDVDAFLKTVGWTDIADVAYLVSPSSPGGAHWY